MSKAHEAAREGQRKEQDLAAQNITAWWTKIMGIAALIGMALSAVGVWWVKTTFDETKAGNIIAKDAQRAWLSIEDLNIEGVWSIYIDGTGYSVAVSGSYTIRNSGSEPALDVDWIEYGWEGQSAANSSAIEEFVTMRIKGDSEGRTCIAPGSTRNCEFSFATSVEAPEGHCFVFMICGVKYRSGAMAGEPRFTIQGYDIFRRQNEGNPTPCTFRPDQMLWDGNLKPIPFSPMIRADRRFEMT